MENGCSKSPKAPLTGRLAGMGFEYGSRLLPVRKVFCSKDFVCTPTQHKAAPSVYFQKVLHTIQRLDNQFRITEKGYSLIFQSDSEPAHMNDPVFHIVSGKKRS